MRDPYARQRRGTRPSVASRCEGNYECARTHLRAKFADQSSIRPMLECLIPANMERASKVLGKLNLPEGTVTQEAMVGSVWPTALAKHIPPHSRARTVLR